MSKARVKPNSSFLKKKNQKSGLLIGEIKVKSCTGMKLRKSATSAKSGTFSPQFKNKPEAEPKPASAAEPAPAPAPAPAPSTGNILFDISIFSGNFNLETGWREGQDENDPNATSDYETLPQTVINALTRAANRWARFLSFTPAYLEVMQTFVPGWKGITLNRFLITTIDPLTGKPTKYLAQAAPARVQNTTFIANGVIYLSKNFFNNCTEYQLFQVLSHELGHVLGFATVKINNGELFPKIYVDPANSDNKFYDEDHFPLAVDAYIHKYKGKTKERGDTVEQCNIDISPKGLIPLQKDGNHWRTTTLTYEESTEPNLYNPDACTHEDVMLYGERPMVVFRGLYNEIMVPKWDEKVDKYLITEITLGALAALYTIWNGREIRNYKLLRGTRSSSASEETSFTLKDDQTIYFDGQVYDPPLSRERKIEHEEEDKSWFKGPIIHNCSACEQIYLDVCGDCS